MSPRSGRSRAVSGVALARVMLWCGPGGRRAHLTVVVGLGVDLVDIARVERALARWGGRLVERLMDPDEAGRLPGRGPERTLALALAVAGKEAASKALGTGWSGGVRWRDVLVEAGPAPTVSLRGRAAEVARALGSSGRTLTRLERRGALVIGEVWLLA